MTTVEEFPPARCWDYRHPGDDGRTKEWLCESCYSVMHGLWDCPEWLDSPVGLRHPQVRLVQGGPPACRGVSRRIKGARTIKADAKRDVRRSRRRAEKRDPENAPRRLRELTRGWAD